MAEIKANRPRRRPRAASWMLLALLAAQGPARAIALGDLLTDGDETEPFVRPRTLAARGFTRMRRGHAEARVPAGELSGGGARIHAVATHLRYVHTSSFDVNCLVLLPAAYCRPAAFAGLNQLCGGGDHPDHNCFFNHLSCACQPRRELRMLCAWGTIIAWPVGSKGVMCAHASNGLASRGCARGRMLCVVRALFIQEPTTPTTTL